MCAWKNHIHVCLKRSSTIINKQWALNEWEGTWMPPQLSKWITSNGSILKKKIELKESLICFARDKFHKLYQKKLRFQERILQDASWDVRIMHLCQNSCCELWLIGEWQKLRSLTVHNAKWWVLLDQSKFSIWILCRLWHFYWFIGDQSKFDV